MTEAITDISASNSVEHKAMADLVEELHKHSNYLYGENVSDCRRLMRQAAVEIKRLRAAQVADRISELDGKLKHERSENARLQAELETARHTITAMAAQINARA
jgi:hypothetical protein